MSIIKILSPLVANQIAAGEVVERPASVLKELLENSIDAKAKRININIEGGGIHRIQVTDDGIGIEKEDLPLAMIQHATSKITSLEDIEEIQSMGFRGEALASISSVAKVEIISKHQSASHAWSLKNQGQGILQPAAHNIGSTVIVEDLFYNTPGRRKFLRRPTTEFHALEEVFRRIALTQFEIAFSLTHDGRLMRRLTSCSERLNQQLRLEQLIGKHAIEHSLFVDIEQNGMRLWGWLGLPEVSRAQADQQYFFINQRVVKDRLVNHALREAYQKYLEAGRYPVYCLYFELSPKELDVNVHPTKHEVRFRHARVVHCFLEDVVLQALGRHVAPKTQVVSPLAQHTDIQKFDAKTSQKVTFSPANRSMDIYQKLSSKQASSQISQACGVSRLLTILGEQYAFIFYEHRIFILDIIYHRYQKLYDEFAMSWAEGRLQSAPLMMAHSVSMTEGDFSEAIQSLSFFGFESSEIGPGSLIIRTVPKPLLGQDVPYQACIEQCLHWTKKGCDFKNPIFLDEINHWFAKELSESPLNPVELMQWMRYLDKQRWMLSELKRYRIKEITMKDCEQFLKQS